MPTTIADKELFRKVVQVVELTSAIKLPSFHHIPATTLYGWARDSRELSVGSLRREGGVKLNPWYTLTRRCG